MITETQFVANFIASTRPSRSGWKDRTRQQAKAEYRSLLAREDKARQEAARLAQEASRAAQKAELDKAGIVRLKHIYGPSYFGSGGGYGRAAGLNAVVLEHGDNGFMAGPSTFQVVDRSLPAEVWAQGGDSIGEGRRWREAYRWDPTTESWGGSP